MQDYETKSADRIIEKNYQSILDALGRPVTVIDTNFKIIYCNQSFRDYFGFDETINGMCCEEIMGREHFEKNVKPHFLLCFKGERTVYEENIHFRGRHLNFKNTCSPLYGENGEITAVVSILHDVKDLTLTEDKLNKQREYIDLFMDSTDNLIFMKDTDYRYIFSNKANTVFHGFKKESEILGKTDMDLMPEQAARNCRVSDKLALEKRKIIVDREEIAGRVYETKKIPVVRDNRITGITGIIRDITDKKKIEEELIKSERKYRNVIENAMEGIFVVQGESIVFSNPISQKISGYSQNELEEMPFSEIVFREDRYLLIQNNKKRLAGMEIAPYDFRIIKKSGGVIWVRISATRITWKDNPAVLCFISDIHERKKTEKALKESEEKFRKLTETSPSAILMYQNNRWVYANTVAVNITGFSLHELYNMNFWEFVHPDYRKKVIENGLKRQSYGRPESSYEFKIITKAGQEKWVELSGASTIYRGEPAAIVSAHEITQRKEAEEKLAKSQANFKFLSDVTFEAIVLHKNGIIQDVNKSFEKMTGYSRDEAIGQNLLQAVVLQEDMKIVKEKITRHHAKPYVIRGKTKSGRLLWFEIEGRNMIHNDETIRIVAIRDISEKIRMQQKIAESEERFKTIFEKAPIMIDSFDSDGNCILWNRECEKILGWQKNEIQSADFLLNKCYPNKGERQRAIQAIDEADGKFREYEVYDRKGNIKTQIWANFVLPGGMPIAVGYDITVRKKAELALEDSLREIETITTNVPSTIWKAELDSKLKLVNSYISKTADELMGEKSGTIGNRLQDMFFKYIMDEDIPFCKKKLKEAIQHEGRLVIFKYRVRKGDGSMAWLQSNCRAMKKDGTILLYGSSIDITEIARSEGILKDSEQKLRDLNAKKDKFFSIIAHDLKSPFNAVLGFSELMLQSLESKDDGKFREYAEQVNQSAQKSYDLLVNLLEWSRSQLGNIKPKKRKMNLSECLSETVSLLQGQIDKKNISMNLNTQKIMLKADRDMISTVMRNIITNAVKYSYQGGQIDITAYLDAETASFSVKDYGVGIASADIEKLFRLDSGLSTPGTNKESGTGLGLVICKEFIDMHNGKIHIESETGGGTKFTVVLPV